MLDSLILLEYLPARRYSEAIHHLYGSNTFIAAHSYFIANLPQFWTPQHLNTIRSFRFIWDYGAALPSPPEGLDATVPFFKIMAWNAVWDSFAGMQGLDKLEVKLIVHPRTWENMDKDKAAIILQPVMAVTRPRVFDLMLTCRCPSDEAPWNTLPCRVRQVSLVGLWQMTITAQKHFIITGPAQTN